MVRLHGEGILAPKEILLAIFQDYLKHMPQSGAFFTNDKARADGVFVKEIIEQLQKISTENALGQLLWKIDRRIVFSP